MNADTLRQTLTLASSYKEGDAAVGGTADDRVRDDARQALLATTLDDIHRTVLIEDGVSVALQRSRDRRFDGELASLTVRRVCEMLRGPGGAAWVQTYGPALGSEAIAAVAKVMTSAELSAVARALFNPLPGDGVTVGGRRHFGSRIQPNSPGDDEREILFSIFDGLAHGCGDVVIGLNPAADDLDTIVRLEQLLAQVVSRLELPTRFCVLSDIVKQHAAQRYTRVDVGFQSLAGTSRALAGMVGLDVDGVADLAGAFDALYFETGQGSEVTNGAADGVDMGTLEARSYGVARSIIQRTRRWTIVNDVAGFIGPEVFRTPQQLERVCLEDLVMAKLHGLTMGLDVCATFHMGIEPAALHDVTRRLVTDAAPAYLMAVAGNADPMLGYLTTSSREHPALRRAAGRSATSAMVERLRGLGVTAADGDVRDAVGDVARLSAIYARAGGDRRSLPTLHDEGREQVRRLHERGFDIASADEAAAGARVDAIYRHARAALYASIDDGVIRDAATRPLVVSTLASSRDEYLNRPASGECLRDDDARTLTARYERALPQVQLVVSDGLNANAINEQLRDVLPALRRGLLASGHHVAESDVIVRNGRVRAGYEIGACTGADLIVHAIGERPGTGLNTLSLYITYGRDEAGAPRWRRDLPHSMTTAICGVHERGKPAEAAVAEATAVVRRAVDARCSGVALTRRF